MREIEFRGKDIKTKEWRYGSLVSKYDVDACLYCQYHILEKSEYSRSCDWDSDLVNVDFYEVDENTLGQFTGLCDNDGNKIYEGDVVKLTRINMYAPSASFNGKDLISFHRVCWNDEKHCFYQEHFDIEKKRVTGAGILCFEDERAEENIIEVIGNIYDNPELVKE